MASDDKKQTVESVAWIAVVFSALAGIGGIWTAWETRNAALTAIESAELDKNVALVRSCSTASAQRFRTGDDLLILNGTDERDTDYQTDLEQSDFRQFTSGQRHYFLRCEFTNYSRVPVLTVSLYFPLEYHKHRVMKTERNFPFPALAPRETRVVWFVNQSAQRVVVHTPERTRYLRFPDLKHYQEQRFQPLTDYWVLTRDFDPEENLDQSMM